MHTMVHNSLQSIIHHRIYCLECISTVYEFSNLQLFTRDREKPSEVELYTSHTTICETFYSSEDNTLSIIVSETEG